MKKDLVGLPCTPLGDFVLLKLITESKTEGGLHLPEKAIKAGIVMAIGPGVDAVKFPLKASQQVFLPRGDNGGHKIGEYFMVQASYISAILNI
jgi:co-chaperonin GroES (HSP10)